MANITISTAAPTPSDFISYEAAVPVNPPDASVTLTRGDVWTGLVHKAEDARAFIGASTCTITQRLSDTQFVRTMERDGEKLDERVTLDEKAGTILFERINGARGTVENIIDSDSGGDMSLRFRFNVAPPAGDVPADGAAREAYEQRMKKGFHTAVVHTLEQMRALKASGKLEEA